MKSETVGADGKVARIPLFVRNSRYVRIYGYSGNATPDPASSLFRFELCDHFLLTNVNPQHVSFGASPETWFSVVDVQPTGVPIRTPGTEWLVVYKRGNRDHETGFWQTLLHRLRQTLPLGLRTGRGLLDRVP